MKPKLRSSPRPRFTLGLARENHSLLAQGVASEWWLFRYLRKISKYGGEIAWMECNGRPLTARSVAALNVYLRSGAIRNFKSRRWELDRELIGLGEWARFCKMLGLTFDGKNTRRVA